MSGRAGCRRHHIYLIIIGLAACGRGDRSPPQLPVDPALDLAIVVPEAMKRLEADFVFVKRAELFRSAAAWAAHERAQNQSYTVAAPTRDGDGWVLTMTKRTIDVPDVRVWYRTLGGGLAITCMAVNGFRAATSAELELTRKACFGTQRVKGRIFVPFQFSNTDKSTHVRLALVGKPFNWRVDLERVADAPAWRFDPNGVDRRQRRIDHGKLADGNWFLSGGTTRNARMHYDVVARRKIGALELACHGDTYRDEAHARRQLALCLGLQKP